MHAGEIALERADEGSPILTVAGEHDLSSAGRLQHELDQLIAERQRIVVDLSDATFVDSSILGVLLGARGRAHAEGLGFAIAFGGEAEAVARVLDVTGLRDTIPVHASRDDALSEASGGPPEIAR